MSSEKDRKKFSPGEKVWAWVSGNQTFEVSTIERHEAHKSLCMVKLKSGTSVELKDDLVHKMNDPKQDASPDNTFMRELNEATLLHNVRARYALQNDDGGVYSYTGHILIAVNPFRELNVYTEKQARRAPPPPPPMPPPRRSGCGLHEIAPPKIG